MRLSHVVTGPVRRGLGRDVCSPPRVSAFRRACGPRLLYTEAGAGGHVCVRIIPVLFVVDSEGSSVRT